MCTCNTMIESLRDILSGSDASMGVDENIARAALGYPTSNLVRNL